MRTQGTSYPVVGLVPRLAEAAIQSRKSSKVAGASWRFLGGDALLLAGQGRAIAVQSDAASERGSDRRLRSVHPVEHVGSGTPSIRFESKADVRAARQWAFFKHRRDESMTHRVLMSLGSEEV